MQQFGEHRLELDVPEGVWTPTPHAIHAILLARRGATRLTLTEIEETINENARHNLARNGATTPARRTPGLRPI